MTDTDGSGAKLRAVVLATLMVFSVFAGTVAFAGTSFAAGNTAGNVAVSIGDAGNTATVTVDDPDLNTDSGSRQSRVLNVQSNSEVVEGSTTAGGDAPDGGSHEFGVASSGNVADRTGDGAITAADFTLEGAPDESITGVTVKSGAYYVTVSDAGSPDDGSAETVTYTTQTTAATGSDTTDGTTTTVTTTSPLGDMNGDGTIDVDDVRLSGSTDESVVSVTVQSDGTADITVGDSGTTSDGSEANGGTREFLSYVPAETVTVVETGPDTGTFSGTVQLAETDSNGTLYVQDGDTVEGIYWEGGSTRVSGSASYTTTDTTAPTVSNVKLSESSGSMVVQFDTDEALGSDPSDIVTTVTGPNGRTYTIDGSSFTKSGTGPYTYTSVGAATFDDGDGTYSLSIDDAKDPAGNNGGNNGAGSGLTASYTYSSGGDTTAPSISGFMATNPSDKTIDITFFSDEKLSSISVGLSGPESATLSRSDFTETPQNGGYTYEAKYSASNTGDFTASLNTAKDSAGNDGASGQSDTVSVSGGDGGGNSLPSAPYVSLASSELSTTQFTSLFVLLNATGKVDSKADLELRFYNATESTATPIATVTEVKTIKGFAMVEVPKAELGAKQFSGKIELVNATSGSVLATDSKTITVYDGVTTSIKHTKLNNTAKSGIEVSYDLGNLDASNAQLVVQSTTVNSGFSTVTKSISQQKGTVTVKTKASDVNRNFTAQAFVRDTARSRQIQSSMSQTCIATPGSPCATVADTSVVFASNGTTVSGVDVATEWNYRYNGLDFYLHPTGQPNTKEINGVSGISSNTDLKVTVTVNNFDPTFVMGNANAEGWDWSTVDANTTKITFTLKPADVYWHKQVENPDPTEWPLKNATATTHYEAVVDMSVISIQNSFADKVQGGMVVSDAQAFAPPQYKPPSNGKPGKLKISVAAPHYESDGSTVNTGFYTAIIPSGIATDWGVDPSQLTATYASRSLGASVNELSSGAIKLSAGLHYSSGTVTISGDPGKPVAKTGSDRTVDEDTSVGFDASSSTDDGSITGYAWDFDGDGATDATGATPSHTFADPGTYDVTLTVTDDSGKTSTSIVSITVADVTPPTASAGSDRTVDEDASVSFDATSSTDNGKLSSYAWDFDGDGTTDSTKKKPSHTFASPGTYDVKLTVTDGGGNTATDTVTVTVADLTPPTAAAGPNRTASVGASVSFDATSSTDNGRLGSYAWDFDGDGTTDSTKKKPSHTFASPGTYDVKLTVTDGGGNTATDTVTVTVESTGSSGSSGGSAGSSSAGTSVSVTEGDGVTNVAVAGASGTSAIDLASGNETVRGVGADRISIETSASEFTLNVSTAASVPETVPAPKPTDVGSSVAGYLQIDHSVSDEDISSVNVTFTVGWDALANGTTASEVVLYRYHDGEWRPLETELVGYTDRGAQFEAESPGLSVFAVGQRRAPAFTVSPSTPDAAAVGESVTVETRVTNDGTANGTTVVTLRADGTVLGTESVTLAPGESTTVALTTTFEAPGSYDLTVEGVDAGTVSVTEASTATATATPSSTATAEPTAEPTATATATQTATATATPTATPDSGPEPVGTAEPTATGTDSAGGPGFGAGLAVLAVLALAAAMTRRRD